MNEVPDKIYLQIKDDSDEDQNEITWCEDRINDTDIKYIRFDLVKNFIPSFSEISMKDNKNE